MLTEIVLKLETSGERITNRAASLFQGVLMERIDPDYAAKMHHLASNPYTQCVLEDDGLIWRITTTNKEAYEKIAIPLLDESFTEFKLNKKDTVVHIAGKDAVTIARKDLMDQFYEEEASKYITVDFLTPTAFKTNGRYWILPEPHFVFQSLMNKYTSSDNEMLMFDQTMLEEIENNCTISGYRMRSVSFPLEGVNIPAFIGNVTYKMNGNSMLARYVKLLLRYGTYSGVGIKTSMGMGAIKITEGRKKVAEKGNT